MELRCSRSLSKAGCGRDGSGFVPMLISGDFETVNSKCARNSDEFWGGNDAKNQDLRHEWRRAPERC
jgi:hypothetical protein